MKNRTDPVKINKKHLLLDIDSQRSLAIGFRELDAVCKLTGDVKILNQRHQLATDGHWTVRDI